MNINMHKYLRFLELFARFSLFFIVVYLVYAVMMTQTASAQETNQQPSQTQPHHWEGNSPEVLLTPTPTLSPGQVQVLGEIRYSARKWDDWTTNDVFNQPLGRVMMELYDRQPGGDVLMATTRADNAGNYTFPPIQNRSGIDLYMKVYATDDNGSGDARVKVVGAADNIWYYPPPGYPSIDVGQNLPDGPVTFNYTIPNDPIDGVSQPFYVFDLTANRAFNWVEGETGWGNQRLLTINWPKPCVIVIGELACYRTDSLNYWEGEGEIRIPDGTELNQDVIIHEYGHFVLGRSNGDDTVILAC